MSGIRSLAIEQIDPRNEPALAAWHATVVAADTWERADVASPWELAEVRADRLAVEDAIKGIYAGIEDGRVVVNTHMVGINERLGFRPVERIGEFQRLDQR